MTKRTDARAFTYYFELARTTLEQQLAQHESTTSIQQVIAGLKELQLEQQYQPRITRPVSVRHRRSFLQRNLLKLGYLALDRRLIQRRSDEPLSNMEAAFRFLHGQLEELRRSSERQSVGSTTTESVGVAA